LGLKFKENFAVFR